jgi:hypothetical protein
MKLIFLHGVYVYTVDRLRTDDDSKVGRVSIIIETGSNILTTNALKKAAPFAMSVDPTTLILSDCSGVLTANLEVL